MKKNKDKDGLLAEKLLIIIESLDIPKKIRKVAQKTLDKLKKNEK